MTHTNHVRMKLSRYLAVILILLFVSATAARGNRIEDGDIWLPPEVSNVFNPRSLVIHSRDFRANQERFFREWWQRRVSSPQLMGIAAECSTNGAALDPIEKRNLEEILAGDGAYDRYNSGLMIAIRFPKALSDPHLRPWITSTTLRLKNEQDQFFPAFRQYVVASADVQRYADAVDVYNGTVSAPWVEADARILPHVQHMLLDQFRRCEKVAFDARDRILAIADEEFLLAVDDAFGFHVGWSKVVSDVMAIVPQSSRNLSKTDAVRELQVHDDMKKYNAIVRQTFRDQIAWWSPLPRESGPTVLVKIASDGTIVWVRIMRSSGNIKVDDKVVEAASHMHVKALPDNYKGAYWHILLTPPLSIPPPSRRLRRDEAMLRSLRIGELLDSEERPAHNVEVPKV